MLVTTALFEWCAALDKLLLEHTPCWGMLLAEVVRQLASRSVQAMTVPGYWRCAFCRHFEGWAGVVEPWRCPAARRVSGPWSKMAVSFQGSSNVGTCPCPEFAVLSGTSRSELDRRALSVALAALADGRLFRAAQLVATLDWEGSAVARPVPSVVGVSSIALRIAVEWDW